MIPVQRKAASVEHHFGQNEHNTAQILGQLFKNILGGEKAGYVDVAAELAVLNICNLARKGLVLNKTRDRGTRRFTG